MLNTQHTLPSLSILNKITIFIIVSAHNSNPNGDPDADNLPRTNPYTGYGIISGVSFKRKIRDYVLNHYGNEAGMDIYIQRGTVQSVTANRVLKEEGYDLELPQSKPLSDEEKEEFMELEHPDLKTVFTLLEEGIIAYDGTLENAPLKAILKDIKGEISKELYGKIEEVSKKKRDKAALKRAQRDAPAYLSKQFWDARVFGYTTPDPAGANRGPVQVTDAESLAPVNIVPQTITSTARTKPSEADGNSNFGKRPVVDHAVYISRLYVNPSLLKQENPMTQRDLDVLLEALWNMYEESRSSARVDMRMEGLLIVEETSKTGLIHGWKLGQRLNVTHDGLYTVDISFNDETLPAGVNTYLVR